MTDKEYYIALANMQGAVIAVEEENGDITIYKPDNLSKKADEEDEEFGYDFLEEYFFDEEESED